MVVLRCTRQLLVRLKQAGDLPDVESTTRLGDWYGNILRIGHRQYLIFVSERSRLPVIIPGRDMRRLGTVLPDAVCDALAAVGVSEADVADERARMSEIAFGRTRNRSILGTINDYAFMARHVAARRAEPETPEALMTSLAQTPVLPLSGARPIDLTLAVLRAEYRVRQRVAPAFDSAGALGRVKGSLAPLAAVAPLTRPARPRWSGNCRSDATERPSFSSSHAGRPDGAPMG